MANYDPNNLPDEEELLPDAPRLKFVMKSLTRREKSGKNLRFK